MGGRGGDVWENEGGVGVGIPIPSLHCSLIWDIGVLFFYVA